MVSETIFSLNSAKLVYKFTILGRLDGSLIQLLCTSQENPIVLAILRENKLQVWLKTPESTTIEFLHDLVLILKNCTNPLILFTIDEKSLLILHKTYAEIGIKNWLVSHNITRISNYTTFESIWGHISRLHFTNGFYQPSWYQFFTGDVNFGRKIVDFAVGMLFNKLLLVIRYVTKAKISTSNIDIPLEAKLPVSLDTLAIIDLETDSLEKNANILCFGIIKENTLTIAFQKDKSNKINFQSFKENMINTYGYSHTYFSYNKDFEAQFLPGFEWLEIREPYYYKYTPLGKTVWLPNNYDPGKGANVPVWYNLYQQKSNMIEKLFWRNLILLHNFNDLLCELALVAIKSESRPFVESGHLTDYKKLRPKHWLELDTHKHLLQHKPVFRPAENYGKYHYFDGKYFEMYKEYKQIEMGIIQPNTEEINSIKKAGYEFVFYREFAEQKPAYGSKIKDLQLLDSRLRNSIIHQGINKLYLFQETAIKHIVQGNDVVITASTGNGKTEAFLIPLLHNILQLKEEKDQKSIKAIIFYPTKALGVDQYQKILKYTATLDLSLTILNGDSSQNVRENLFRNVPDILITTPDYLHYNLFTPEIQKILSELQIIVLDEIHTYQGILGTHLHYLLWRIERIILPKIQYITLSATVGNPKAFVSSLIGRSVRIITCRSPKKPKIEVYGIFHKYPNYKISYLVTEVMKDNETILIFRNSQQSCEKSYDTLQKVFLEKGIAIHRGGYQKEVRESVEHKLKSGLLKAVVSTSTLELGIDIGQITTIITPLTSYNNFLQRIGRAGRRDTSARVFVELSNNPVGAYYANNPNHYFGDIADISFNPDNDTILEKHIVLAIKEQQFSEIEVERNSNILQKLIQSKLLIENNSIITLENNFKHFSLRSGLDVLELRTVKHNKLLGTREFPYALYEYHPQSTVFIYGKSWVIEEWLPPTVKNKSWVAKLTLLAHKPDSYRTNPIISKSLKLKSHSKHEINKFFLLIGKIDIILTLSGYHEKSQSKGTRKVYVNPINYILATQGVVIDFTELIISKKYEKLGILSHSLSHVIFNAVKMVLGLQNEIKLLEKKSEDKNTSTIIMYDNCVGGNGLSQLIVKNIDKILNRAKSILVKCSCSSNTGCPRCLYLNNCPKDNNLLLKKETLALLNENLKK